MAVNLKEQFDSIACDYDQQRRQLIPCFDDYYGLALKTLPYPENAPIRVLDIGCGTGLFSALLLARYPEARLTLIDLSDQMLGMARQRFAGHANIRYILADYTRHDWQGDTFDLVISALSIHHLPAQDKAHLYKTVYTLLAPGGIFLNADQALSPSPGIETMHSNLWRQSVERSGLPSEQIVKAYERVACDNPSTMEEQLQWLREAGFSHVDCIYKYCHFTVFYARK